MSAVRTWGRYPTLTEAKRQRIIALLKKDPEEIPMRLIARLQGVGYKAVRQINNAEGIRPKKTR